MATKSKNADLPDPDGVIPRMLCTSFVVYDWEDGFLVYPISCMNGVLSVAVERKMMRKTLEEACDLANVFYSQEDIDSVLQLCAEEANSIRAANQMMVIPPSMTRGFMTVEQPDGKETAAFDW